MLSLWKGCGSGVRGRTGEKPKAVKQGTVGLDEGSLSGVLKGN